MPGKKNDTLGLVITDGVGYRNFILSDFLLEASKEYKRLIIYSGLPAEVYDKKELPKVEIRELPVFTEGFRTWFWRKSKEVAHLQLHRDFFGIRDSLEINKSLTNSNRGRATRFIYKITNKFHSEKVIGFLEKRQKYSLARQNMTKSCGAFLASDRPDLLLFTHQRPPYVVPLVFAAEKHQIRTCSFIFSWDNLPSKGRMAASFQSFLVWSELMKKELNHFYPKTKDLSVGVVGTPQFEPYVIDRYQSSKELFQEQFNIDLSIKTICYSCGDASTSKNDPVYIKAVAGFIEDGKLGEEVNFIVRTSPAEDGSRFKAVAERYSFIKWNYPQWVLSRENHPEPWSQRVPEKEDLVTLRSLLEYCDLNINMCSTMSLDFMLFDKPVINPVFGTGENGLFDDQKYLKYTHYERVVKSGAVAIAENEEELLQEIKFSLQAPKARIGKQRELLELQIGKPLEGTSNRIAKTLRELV